MIKDTETDTDPPSRDSVHARWHLYSGIIILIVLVTLELTIGSGIRDRDFNASSGRTRWARMSHQSYEHAADKEQILYISNSHAITGGKVSVHLQRLLDEIYPDTYEVMDLAAPGIFAPEMLQRVLLGMQREPDVVVMAVAYISFSDRMKLALQSHSARSFFQPGIFEHLSPGFWMRNYDISLYLDTFLKQKLSLLRYRNQLRDLWERPVVNYLKDVSGNEQIIFLEVDEDERWKFPDGFDSNLFNWRLYSGDRQGHMADLADAIKFINSRSVPLLGINLPIHWGKSEFRHQEDDYQSYRQELAEKFTDSLEFVDYQDSFPSEFTTYDALHPTWHGARLHALDIMLRLHRQGILPGKDPEAILEAFTSMGYATSEIYRKALSGKYEVLGKDFFKRYDLFEPDNAIMLMRWLTTFDVDSYTSSDHLYELSLRFRYWQEHQFGLQANETDDHYSTVFNRAARSEVDRSRQHAKYFQQQVVKYQSKRLEDFPLPELDTATLVDRRLFGGNSETKLFQEQYLLPDSQVAVVVRHEDGREIARGMAQTGTQSGFLRVDVFGDGSFLMMQDLAEKVRLPTWVTHTRPFVRFGI